jgi:YbgC/YbaW family acyl-CoA thioester hydrolase
MTTRSEFRHLERLRVRWAEVDMQKVVFNGHYLTYFDTAITGLFRAMALPWEATLEQLGGDLFVRKATLDYAAPARCEDQLDVGMRVARIGTSSIVFEGMVFRAEQTLVGCELVYVFTQRHAAVAAPVPAVFREALQAWADGAPMVEVGVDAWQVLGAEAQAIRAQVFVREQGIPMAMDADAHDAVAVHAVARNRLGLALATGRLMPAQGGCGRIGRMAVRRELRGSGVGRAVLEALLDQARRRGDAEVALHAQATAVGFYRRAGFVERGAPFQEAGIEHREMARTP